MSASTATESGQGADGRAPVVNMSSLSEYSIGMIRSRLRVTKQTARARQGLVVAEHPVGAEVGAAILARGGNAVDAAVATAFAMTVVEPFMSTIAGGGTMLLSLAGAARSSRSTSTSARRPPATSGSTAWPGPERGSALHLASRRRRPEPLWSPVGRGPGSVAASRWRSSATAAWTSGRCWPRRSGSPARASSPTGISPSPPRSSRRSCRRSPRPRGPISGTAAGSTARPGMEPGDRIRFPDLARSLELIARDGARLLQGAARPGARRGDARARRLPHAEDLANYAVAWPRRSEQLPRPRARRLAGRDRRDHRPRDPEHPGDVPRRAWAGARPRASTGGPRRSRRPSPTASDTSAIPSASGRLGPAGLQGLRARGGGWARRPARSRAGRRPTARPTSASSIGAQHGSAHPHGVSLFGARVVVPDTGILLNTDDLVRTPSGPAQLDRAGKRALVNMTRSSPSAGAART